MEVLKNNFVSLGVVFMFNIISFYEYAYFASVTTSIYTGIVSIIYSFIALFVYFVAGKLLISKEGISVWGKLFSCISIILAGILSSIMFEFQVSLLTMPFWIPMMYASRYLNNLGVHFASSLFNVVISFVFLILTYLSMTFGVFISWKCNSTVCN